MATRPFAGALVMGPDPLADLFDRQPRQRLQMSGSPVLGKQFGEGGATRESAVSPTEGILHASPSLARFFRDRSRLDVRPSSRSLAIRVRPCKHHFGGELIRLPTALDPESPCEESVQRRSAFAKSFVDVLPTKLRSLVDGSCLGGRPISGPPVVSFGPCQDL
jgi:hypothetical protein